MQAPLGGVAPRPRAAKTASAPPIPPGALRGDPSRQPFSPRAQKLFYVDVEKRCRGCGVTFVLTARAQKGWVETLGLRLDSRAARCPACRSAFLGERGPTAALADASRALAGSPLHAPAVLAYARAAAACASRFGHAPLESALAALAALRRHDPTVLQALYLEGLCHEASGRAGRAAHAFRRFLAAAANAPGLTRQVRDAGKRLAALPRPSRTS